MTALKSKCRFCGKAMTVQVDDDYAELGDPYSLLPMATCNHCGDVREKRQKAHEWVLKVCNGFRGVNRSNEETMERLRTALLKAVRGYARMSCDIRGRTDSVFPVETTVEKIVATPDRAEIILRELRAEIGAFLAEQPDFYRTQADP